MLRIEADGFGSSKICKVDELVLFVTIGFVAGPEDEIAFVEAVDAVLISDLKSTVTSDNAHVD